MKRFLTLALLLAPLLHGQLRPGQISEAPAKNLLRPGSFGEAPLHPSDSADLIEAIPLSQSHINWTQGIFVTDYSLPITYQDPNVGQSVINSTARLKEELQSSAARAMGGVRASSFLNLADYFSRDEDVRNNLLSLLFALPVENTVIEKSAISGTMVFPLYGVESLSRVFYQNIKKTSFTNYLTRGTLENYYDTLIIDLVMFKTFNPSLMPRILNQQGDLVHGVETVDANVLNRQGPVHYVTSITEALRHPARGKKIAYILPAEVSGSMLSDIILFDSDVQNIFSQQRSLDAFRQGRVILIHSR